MPEVLLLCEYATLNGGERSMLATLDGVRAAGFTPAVVAPPLKSLASALRARGVEVVPLPFYNARGTRCSKNELREFLAGLIRRRRPDVLHANSLSMGRLSGPVAAELGVPSLAHLRDIIKLSRQAMADLNRHRRLLAVSAATRDYHVSRGLAAERTHVLYNGVDLKQFRPRSRSGYLHGELGLPPEARLVGTIGQIALRKGQDVLARAAAIVAETSPNLHFLIAGRRHSQKDESREFEMTLRAAATGALAGRWHLLGLRDDVDRILGELTLLVHPARQEPLGRVLLEAAASGVATIATDVGGTGEIFPAESKSARLVPPDAPHAMAAAIAELALDQSMRSRLAASARRRAEEAFDVSCAVANLVGHYQELTG